jgi:hypothetical protein
MRFLFLTLILTVGFSNYAQAGLSVGARAAITETRQSVDDLKNIQIRTRLHKVVSAMIENGTLALAEAGHMNEANRIRREWQVVEKKIFGLSDALGDHRPLSQWLANVYNSMERILGKARMEALHLDDIYIVNYAVPVVITPKNGWDKNEYSLHFVPFTGVVVFWSSLRACMNAFGGNKYLRQYCYRISSTLERRVTSDIAPRLSNFVFDKFNNRIFQGQFNITEEEMVRRYGPELSRIQ